MDVDASENQAVYINRLSDEAKHSTLVLTGAALVATKDQYQGMLAILMKWVDCTDAAIQQNNDLLIKDLGIIVVEPVKLFIDMALIDVKKLCATKMTEDECVGTLKIEQLGGLKTQEYYESNLPPIDKKRKLIEIYGDIIDEISNLTHITIPPLRPYGGKDD